MLDHIFLFSGASAVGKTSVLRSLIPLLQHKGAGPCVCKIDCLQSEDASVFAEMNLPCVTGRSPGYWPNPTIPANWIPENDLGKYLR